MRTGYLAPLYADQSQPFVTVWMETTHESADAEHQIQLRWQALADRLRAAGAGPAEVDSLYGAVGRAEIAGPQSQLLIGQGGRVLVNYHLPGRPSVEVAHRGQVPHLMPWLTARSAQMPYLLVLVDRQGADIRVRDAALNERTEQVEGGDYPIEKNAPGGWSQPRYQRAAENLWEHNAREVSDLVDELRRRHRPPTIILAGDVRARAILTDGLPPASAELVTEIATGGRAEGVSREALDEALIEVTDARYRDAAAAAALRYQQEIGRADRATGGLSDTIAALREGRVDTLLVDRPELDGAARIGPEPTQLAPLDETRELAETPTSVERADAAIARAAICTDAELLATPPGHPTLVEHVGAILRY